MATILEKNERPCPMAGCCPEFGFKDCRKTEQWFIVCSVRKHVQEGYGTPCAAYDVRANLWPHS